ncbi:MAG: hypothetical protein OXN17_19750 [Candidatus Poribacteria bacterium]|nr:hypothetical protein [Candidatus Poribacteria bacterium]MDE0502794.1 hypothetical protein [Candidatus Poribacteria bacterium]
MTAGVFPLLAFDNIAQTIAPDVFTKGSADYFINEGITKIESMMMPDNYFAYWPGGNYTNFWGSIFAAHFLVEARKAGYQVSDRVYQMMLESLKQEAKRQVRGRHQLERIAYAVYVLAAAGESEKSTMLYLKNNRLDALSDYSEFQLAGAFALSGDVDTAVSMLPINVSPTVAEKRETGGNFNSPVRAQAIMLDVLAEVHPDHPSVSSLVKSLTDAASGKGRWQTTQENAFAFLALGKILEQELDAQYTGTITMDGERYAEFEPTDERYASKEWGGKRVQLSLEGTGNSYYQWRSFGVETGTSIEEFDRELQVRRRYLSESGEPIEGSIFKHGDMIVAEISVKALTANLENVVVVDMLPAGFEIENPRLESRAGIPWLPNKRFKPDYVDIRDDRLIFFGKFPRRKGQKFYYALRAVTQGEFTLPPVTAEAMYDPSKSSVASGGSIKIAQ